MAHILPIALTHLAAFLLFLWVCNKYAVGPVLSLLDERRDKIAAEFDEIDRGKKRVSALKEDYEANLREIDEEARKRVQEEVTRARRIAEEIVENARAEAGEILEKARANTEIQIEQARAEIKDEIVAMTIATTERLLKESLDDAKHREMVGVFIDELGQQRN